MDNIVPKCTKIKLLSVTELLIGWIFKKDGKNLCPNSFLKFIFKIKKQKLGL